MYCNATQNHEEDYLSKHLSTHLPMEIMYSHYSNLNNMPHFVKKDSDIKTENERNRYFGLAVACMNKSDENNTIWRLLFTKHQTIPTLKVFRRSKNINRKSTAKYSSAAMPGSITLNAIIAVIHLLLFNIHL